MQLKEASILLVDDEPFLLDLIDGWFQGVAREVFRADNGARALTVIAEHRVDVIVSDVRMPVMDGISLIKEVNANKLHTPRVIFISGFTDIEPREAYALGAEAFLGKPFERSQLISAVNRSLSERSELWQTPPDPAPDLVLNRSFASLAAALQERRIAFGRRGFCTEAGHIQAEGPINIELEFKTDPYVLSGQGIIRWVAHQENLIGVELTYVAEKSRARALQLTERSGAFIPRTTGGGYLTQTR
jgi:CheY-like chemotaxis protein